MRHPAFAISAAALLCASCASVPPTTEPFDVLIDNGTIVDGSGSAGYFGDVAIRGDTIVAVGAEITGPAIRTIDARGLTVTPGFINMLSWAVEDLIEDGAGESDIRQGVTTEIFGEGTSWGPLVPASRDYLQKGQSNIRYDITWSTLAEYLEMLEARGVAPNVASFIGAETVRVNVLGYNDVDPDEAQLAQMQGIVRKAMNEGALGVASSLIYAPGSFAETPELISIASASAQCGGMYISHLRNESDDLLEAVDELITIARESGGPAEIYHLKQAGQRHWDKLDEVIAKVEAARAEGLRITADMYTYTAGSTGLDAAMPTWVQEGGYDAWATRLKDPDIRARVIGEMRGEPDGWESLYFHAGGPQNVLLVGFKNPELQKYTGKRLSEVAGERGTSPEDTIIDLVIEDGSRVQTIYFLMDEENVARQTQLPWMSFGSDSGALAPRGVFLEQSNHPRAFGTFARLLGKYVREERRLSLEEAVRKMTSLPASNVGFDDRGLLAVGKKADIAIFDAATIDDRATYEDPKQFAVGIRHVLVNGETVLENGTMTGARPGRALEGPGTGQCPAR
jgi:N-acyl-D-amino-acid deacylase